MSDDKKTQPTNLIPEGLADAIHTRIDELNKEINERQSVLFNLTKDTFLPEDVKSIDLKVDMVGNLLGSDSSLRPVFSDKTVLDYKLYWVKDCEEIKPYVERTGRVKFDIIDAQENTVLLTGRIMPLWKGEKIEELSDTGVKIPYSKVSLYYDGKDYYNLLSYALTNMEASIGVAIKAIIKCKLELMKHHCFLTLVNGEDILQVEEDGQDL